MKVGVDLDGVISRATLYNPSIKLPCWLFFFLTPFVLVSRPNKITAEALRRIKEGGNEIIIISARPPWMIGLSEWWLRFHKIPFTKIFCVGFGKGTRRRKLRVIEQEGIELFFDNDERLVRLLNDLSIGASTTFE